MVSRYEIERRKAIGRESKCEHVSRSAMARLEHSEFMEFRVERVRRRLDENPRRAISFSLVVHLYEYFKAVSFLSKRYLDLTVLVTLSIPPSYIVKKNVLFSFFPRLPFPFIIFFVLFVIFFSF